MRKELEGQVSEEQTPVSIQSVDSQQAMLQRTDRFLIQAQYEQLHEMRREYNRVLFQAPTIVVTIVGASLAVLPFLLGGGNQVKFLNPAVGLIIFISISGFVFTLGYWTLRSQILLRAAERTLKALEKTYGDSDLMMYPYEVNATLSAWKRWPSSLFIVLYMFILGLVLLIVGLVVVLAAR